MSCPASRRAAPGHGKCLPGVGGRGRKGEVLNVVLQRKIRTGKQVSDEAANHGPQGRESAGVIQSLPFAEHGIHTVGIISRNFGWLERYKALLGFKQSRFFIKN